MRRLLNAKVGSVDKGSVRKVIDGNAMKKMFEAGATEEVGIVLAFEKMLSSLLVLQLPN